MIATGIMADIAEEGVRRILTLCIRIIQYSLFTQATIAIHTAARPTIALHMASQVITVHTGTNTKVQRGVSR